MTTHCVSGSLAIALAAFLSSLAAQTPNNVKKSPVDDGLIWGRHRADRAVLSTPEARAAVEYVRRLSSADVTLRYVGSEVCLACHQNYEGWRRSAHGTSLKTLTSARYSLQYKDGVVSDYDNNGIDDFVQGLDLSRAGR
jgi:hypothetical protein